MLCIFLINYVLEYFFFNIYVLLPNMNCNWWSDSTGIYSVDMLISWVNDFKIKHEKRSLSNYKQLLCCKIWGDFTPIDVLLHPKKHPEHYSRIIESNTSFPVLLYNNVIIDGYHRLSKSILEDAKYINCIDIPTSVWKKCFLGKKWESIKIDNIHEVIALYNSKFKPGTSKFNNTKTKVSTKHKQSEQKKQHKRYTEKCDKCPKNN